MYLKDLLRYRQSWLGAAMLWIILCHLPFDLPLISFPISLGYGGVDICFFASGIGCYYSLSSDSDIGNFIQRRLKRLMPTYCVFMVVWLAVKWILGEFSIPMAIGNLLALQHFSGNSNSFNWYVGAALLFYFLAPYFKLTVDRSSPARRYLHVLFLFLCSVPFWHATNLIITAARLPIFYIGMLFAQMCMQSRRISRGCVIGACAAFLAGGFMLAVSFKYAPKYLWSHGLYWYPFVLLTPPLCMAISFCLLLLEKVNAARPLLRFLSLCGSYSFELYLVHALLFSLIPLYADKFSSSGHRYLIWAVGCVLIIPGCFILRRLTTFFTGLSRKSQYLRR